MSIASTFDAELLRRYDRPGPRYTSYPTAPQFTGTFGEAQIREYARRTNSEAALDFLGYFMEALQRLHPLVTDGLVAVSGNFILATARGRPLLRVIAMCFDRYLGSESAAAEKPQFSRLI